MKKVAKGLYEMILEGGAKVVIEKREESGWQLTREVNGNEEVVTVQKSKKHCEEVLRDCIKIWKSHAAEDSE